MSTTMAMSALVMVHVQMALLKKNFMAFVSFDSCLAAFQDGSSETESSACNAIVSSERELAEPENPPVSYID